MIPTTWLALILFLLVVSPGLFFDLLAARRRVGTVESAFREIGRVAMGSLGFTLVTLLAVLGLRQLFPRLFLDPHALILTGNTYLADHYGDVVLTIVVAASVSHALAFGLHKRLAMRDGETIRKVSVWSKAFKQDVPDGHAVFARVRLSSGIVYTGQIENFSPEIPVADRELLLTKPLAVKFDAGSELTSLPDAYSRVIVPGSEVEVIAVEYRPAPPMKPRKKRWKIRI